MPYGDEYQQLRGPLKGGGGIKTKPIAQPINLMKSLLEKLALPLLTSLRAGLKNWITTIIGVCMIVMGIFDGGEVSMEIITAGIAMIFARDAGKSSQESGIRPEIIETK
jgi:hypothetical protein